MEALAIDPRSPLPLHTQAEQQLRKLMNEPRYRDGELLPDELTLAATLGISRGTLRTALTRLVAEGLLERRAGIGTRVKKQPAESSIVAWRSLTREMAAKGIAVETFAINCKRCPATLAAAAALMIERGSPVLRLDRLRGWDGTPVLHSRSWLHPRLTLKGTEDFAQPLYEVLQRETGIVAFGAREELLAVPANLRMARLLQVELDSPLLLRRHTVVDCGERPFEFAEIHYVSDRYSLSIDLRRGDS